MTNNRTALSLAAIILLTGCASPEEETGISSAEERQLDEAAAALDDAQADYEAAIQTPGPDPVSETEDEAEQ